MPSALPPRCPSCGAGLLVVKMECPACHTEVTGEYHLCPVCRLDAVGRRLFGLFVAARGNVREVQAALGVSYPTARQRVDALFRELAEEEAPKPSEVLRRLRAGEIDVQAAERLLRGR